VNGIAIQRNPILSSICKRVLRLNSNVEFINDVEMEQFKSIVYRKKLGENQEKLGEKQEKLGENQEKLGEKQEKLGEKLSKNKQKLLTLVKENPNITINMLSESIGISTTAIENNIKALKQSNILKRLGSDKSGKWEVVYENQEKPQDKKG